MAEFEETLGAILNDPQAMGQIMALARTLSGNSAPSTEHPPSPSSTSLPQTEPHEAVFEPVTFEEPQEAPDATASGGLNIDPRLLQLGMRAIAAYRDPNDEKAALLQALRPFVKEERFSKVDKAVQIARISKAIRAVLDGIKGGGQGV